MENAFEKGYSTIQNIKDVFRTPSLASHQRGMFSSIAQYFSTIIKAKECQLKDLLYNAIIKWQCKNQQKASKITSLKPLDKLKQIKEIFNLFRVELLERCSLNYEDLRNINNFIEMGFTYYKRNFFNP
ncbi:MAG: hypothetical protein GF383_04635 [Candidatus Lokiarchaeota archaeon]|nr:hypothetical protein [Candidatus Lokiarchaeota archaeon]MBD3339072.1 hypothetical protein [Candidatus Lokiarchaeota archaeon]